MKSVDILLATYKPNISYFSKLLTSLNCQSYPKINLIVRDDSANDKDYLKITALLSEIITNFNCRVFRNEINMGSNDTFEKLTEDSDADYIAYCDQDDIWEKDKIEKLVANIEKERAVLCYSDLSIIDCNDKLTAKSFKDIHKRLKHFEGDNLFDYFLRRNSVTGCTMLINSSIAKKAIPFSNYYVHDHWLTLYSSSVGRISYVPQSLVRYRLHEGNQIGSKMLIGIESKSDYYQKKLLIEKKKFLDLLETNRFSDKYNFIILDLLKWTEERIDFFENKTLTNTLLMFKKIPDDYQLILFEMLLSVLPNKQSKFLLKSIK